MPRLENSKRRFCGCCTCLTFLPVTIRAMISVFVPTAASASALPKLPTTAVSAALNSCCTMLLSAIGSVNRSSLPASGPCHWLPNIFSALQRDYPGIGYEMLLGDYDEVERWIGEGRVDCGFLRLPTLPGFDTMLLKQDEYNVVLPVGHPLAARESVPIEALNGLPFLLLEHGGKTEVSDLLERAHVQPDVRFTTWEDFAIMAMAERGLGVGILPDLILRRIPYRIEIRPLANPYYRPTASPSTPLPPDARSQEVHRIPAVPGSGRMTPRCRICSHTFFLFLLEIKHIFFRRTG